MECGARTTLRVLGYTAVFIATLALVAFGIRLAMQEKTDQFGHDHPAGANAKSAIAIRQPYCSFPAPTTISSIAFTRNNYVLAAAGAELVVFDPRKGVVQKRIQVDLGNTATLLEPCTFNQEIVYVSTRWHLYRYNLRNEAIEAKLETADSLAWNWLSTCNSAELICVSEPPWRKRKPFIVDLNLAEVARGAPITEDVRIVQVDSDDSALVCYCQGGLIQIINRKTGAILKEIFTEIAVDGMRLSDDGHWIAIYEGGSIRVYDRRLSQFKHEHNCEGQVGDMFFASNSRYLVYACILDTRRQGDLTILDLVTGQRKSYRDLVLGPIAKAAASRDGEFLAISGVHTNECRVFCLSELLENK
jgi:hypothetical protein